MKDLLNRFKVFFLKWVVTLFLLNSGIQFIQAQSIHVKGVLKDSITNEPVAYAAIIFENTSNGATTNEEGLFELTSNKPHGALLISSLGYETKRVNLQKGKTNQSLEIFLIPSAIQLNEIVVKPKRERYSRKNNPAVDLIKNVINRKDSNHVTSREMYQAECYEKLSLSLDQLNMNFDKNKFSRKFQFLDNHFDTSKITGRPILTLSLREKLSDIYYQKAGDKQKKIIKASQQMGIEQTLDRFGTMTANLEEILKEINLYDNDINFLLNRFVSPLSSTMAITYYHYYIMDTVQVEGEPCVDLAFVPVNPQSYGFTGRLYITLDGSYAVKKVFMQVSKRINLNYVKDLRIEQVFKRLDDGKWALGVDQTDVIFFFVNGGQYLYANQTISYDKFTSEVVASDSIFKLLGDVHTVTDKIHSMDSFWISNRHVPLNYAEDNVEDLLTQLNHVPLVRIFIKTIEILSSGYIPIHSNQEKNKIDIGPMNTTLSSNLVEGLRLRFGGTTTANLSPYFFAGGYMAYGSKDQKIKYRTHLTYSFNKKKYHEMESPIHNLIFRHEYDLYTPGQDFQFTDKDNVFVAVKIGKSIEKMNYLRTTALQYEKEWRNGLSVKSWIQQINNRPTGTLEYTLQDVNNQLTPIRSINTTEWGLRLRYAPGELPFNSRNGKESNFNLSGSDVPVFKLSHQVGFKRILGGQYDYNHTEASIDKKIWLSSFGHINATIKAGKVWNKVPFPLLIMPNTNQSLTIQPESFHLMNALEFVTDQYVMVDASYFMKGMILNRIPYLNSLGIREVVSFTGIFGNLSKMNNPAYFSGLFVLPEDTYPLGNKPYMEFSFGLENIFRILQVNYYRRLSYLNHPDIQKNGFRIAMRFSF